MRSPMFCQVTNLTDGSRHLLLGTLHRPFCLTKVFPSKFSELLREANILIGESKYDDPDELLRYSDPVLSHIRRRRYHLKDILGNSRMRKLQAMFDDSKNPIYYWRFVIETAIKTNDVALIIHSIRSHAQCEAFFSLPGMPDHQHPQRMILDDQIPAAAKAASRNKTQFVGLETSAELQDNRDRFYSVATKTLTVEDPEVEWGVERLRAFIDADGLDQQRARCFGMYDDFLKGRLMRYNSDWWWPAVTEAQQASIRIDDRNSAWLATGKLQKYCVKGNKCLIYVGVNHVFYLTAPLISLLRNEGFAVETLTQDGFSKFNFCV